MRISGVTGDLPAVAAPPEPPPAAAACAAVDREMSRED